MRFSITFDVEPDLHTGNYESITHGLKRIKIILDRHKIKGTFFVTCDCIEKHPQIFQNLKKEGHEIALHGFRHVRFDELTIKEKEEQITKSIAVFQKYLNQNPEGFRAPQLSIDKQTLDLLSKYEFKYDSSYSPANLLLLLFYPKKFKHWSRHFFSKNSIYKIRKNLHEIPTTSFLFPFVSIVFRAFPQSLTNLYVSILKIFSQNIIFYAHSWDFIKIPESRVDRKWPTEKLQRNLDVFLRENIKNHKFSKLTDMIKNG